MFSKFGKHTKKTENHLKVFMNLQIGPDMYLEIKKKEVNTHEELY
jgi:hypothetical protein